MTETPRDKLENEVRIAARKPRSVYFIDQDVNVRGVPFSAIEDVGEKIATILKPFLEMAVRPSGVGDPGAGVEPEVLAQFNMGQMAQVAPGIRDVAKLLIEKGTDAEWDAIRDHDWMAVVSLAMEVLKYNLGPELRDFLSSEVRAIGEVFGIKGIESVTTEPKQSLSEPGTAKGKSPN